MIQRQRLSFLFSEHSPATGQKGREEEEGGDQGRNRWGGLSVREELRNRNTFRGAQIW